MNLYESMNKGFEKKYNLDESKNLNEDFSDQLPTWAQKAIAGSKYNQELKKKLSNQNIDLANAEVEIIDPSTLTARGVKTGIDEDGNVLILKMAVGEPYNPYKDNFVYIPGTYNDDYSLTNPRTGKWQQVKYMPAKDVINYVTDAIRIAPTSGLSSLRKDRAAAKKKSIDRGEGQYLYTSRYDGETKWVQTKGQDKSGYPIPDVTKLYSKLVQLTPDNYEDTFAYADKKLNEVKEAITNLLQNPDVQSNLFKKKFGFFNNNILRELSDLEEATINISKELEDIKSSVRKAVEKGEADDEFFKWMNSDGFYTLKNFRKHIKEINDDIKELLNKIKPMEESLKEKQEVNEGYRELKQLNYEELLAKYDEIQDNFFNTYLIPVFEGKVGPLEDGGYATHEFIKFRDTKEGRKALFKEIYTDADGNNELNTTVSLSIPDFLNIIKTKNNMHD